jgi:Tfp pilus assembly protein PilF
MLRRSLSKRFTRILLVVVSITAAACLGEGPEAHAQGQQGFVNYAAVGHAKFTAKKYDEAIDAFKRHLRRAPRDFNAWNQLGAAYYHTGQPRKALRHLKHVQRITSEKSYNYYYQGLCYVAAGVPEKAKQYLNFAALRFSDEYASRALFEMAAIEYKAKNKPRANYYVTLYLQRYPTGVFAGQAGRMLQSLREDKWLDDVEGAKKPDMEEALFKYNKLSLNPRPHYWFAQGGGQVASFSGQEPAPGGGIKARNYQNMAGIANAGIGAGPWREGDMTAFGGYTYRQLWYTDQDRLDTWTDDMTDFEYFFLRGDLLERRHQFYADFRRDVAKLFYFGIFGRVEFARIGSSLAPSPDNKELRKVLKISDTQLLIPWIGASYADNMRTLFYLYMRKEINEDSPDHSNKTYDLGFKGEKPTFSLGISHEMTFPELSLEVGVELFHYEFIYNDYWLDYKRDGFFLSAEHEFVPRWNVSGVFGYYRDSYILDRIKLRPCGSGIENSQAGGGGGEDPAGALERTPHRCQRDDTGMLYQVGVYWNWTQFTRIAGQFQIVENKNPKEKEFEESKQAIQVTYTMAFPSVKRVSRFIDRYADTAFTKDAE